MIYMIEESKEFYICDKCDLRVEYNYCYPIKKEKSNTRGWESEWIGHLKKRLQFCPKCKLKLDKLIVKWIKK